MGAVGERGNPRQMQSKVDDVMQALSTQIQMISCLLLELFQVIELSLDLAVAGLLQLLAHGGRPVA